MRIIVALLVLLLVYWSLGDKSVRYPLEDMSDRFRWAGDAESVQPHPWPPQ
jgi:hypothetical protein